MTKIIKQLNPIFSKKIIFYQLKIYNFYHLALVVGI